MPRLTKAQTWEESTACVSDLEAVQTELENLQKEAQVGQIVHLQKACRLIAEAVEVLMNEMDNK